jgi:hypothetical protein
MLLKKSCLLVVTALAATSAFAAGNSSVTDGSAPLNSGSVPATNNNVSLSNQRITDPGARAPSTTMTLGTRTGSEIGLSAAFYRYQESSVGVTEQGPKAAIDYSGTYKFKDGPFLRGELKYANGPASYSSVSGSKTNPNWYAEARALIGFDMNFASYDISPYTGVGYRYLEDKAAGYTSIGDIGYDRRSQYLYIPIGFIDRVHVGSNSSRLTTTMEFDFLVAGQQKSSTSSLTGNNGVTAAGDLTNNQHSGIGLRMSSVYETRNWSIGPYFVFWNIGQSDVSSFNVTQNGVTSNIPAIEPTNNTIEFGIRGALRF